MRLIRLAALTVVVAVALGGCGASHRSEGVPSTPTSVHDGTTEPITSATRAWVDAHQLVMARLASIMETLVQDAKHSGHDVSSRHLHSFARACDGLEAPLELAEKAGEVPDPITQRHWAQVLADATQARGMCHASAGSAAAERRVVAILASGVNQYGDATSAISYATA